MKKLTRPDTLLVIQNVCIYAAYATITTAAVLFLTSTTTPAQAATALQTAGTVLLVATPVLIANALALHIPSRRRSSTMTARI